jgi:hypothetical protein
MTTPAAGQRYWLGGSPPEVDHLLAQAEFLAPAPAICPTASASRPAHA